MGTWAHLVDGFAVALQPYHLLFCLLGVLVGEVIGALPGIGSTTGVALLVPLTFGMDPVSAIVMLTGIYYGCMYGGTLSSVLIDVPGESSSVMTAVDGHQMAMKGRAGQALFIAAFGSFVAGTFAIILLSFFAPPLARFGLRFGPPEMAALMILALTSVAWLSGESLPKGLLSAVLGLSLAVVGVDSVTGRPRFTMGMMDLLDGISFLPVVIGVFGITEALLWLETKTLWKVTLPKLSVRSILPSVEEWAASKWAIVRGTVLGFVVGLIPAGGATTASFLSYTLEKQVSRHPERLGQGAIEGVAGPESANNSGAIATYVPLLALGIPGGPTVAVLAGAFMLLGLRPGPLLFQEQPKFVWGIIAAMYVANFILLAMNTLAIPALVRVLGLPAPVLMGVVGVISLVGGYSIDNNLFEVWIVLLAGALGYGLHKFKMPIPPLVLALVLGPDLETAFRQSFMLSQGSPAIFLTRPISLVFLTLAAASLVAPVVSGMLRSRRAHAQALAVKVESGEARS